MKNSKLFYNSITPKHYLSFGRLIKFSLIVKEKCFQREKFTLLPNCEQGKGWFEGPVEFLSLSIAILENSPLIVVA